MDKVKLIVSDLDGTLLGANSVLEEITKELLMELKKQQITFVPATSRGLASIPKEIIDYSGRFIIYSNGAAIYDKLDNKNIYENLMSKKELNDLLTCLKGRDYILSVAQNGRVYTEQRLIEMLPYGYPKSDYDKKIKVETRELLVMGLSDEVGIEKMHLNFLDENERKVCLGLLSDIKTWSVSSSWHDNIEVTGLNVNKGNAVNQLEMLLDINSHETMTIGDGLNDVTMLQDRVNSVAMKNASGEVQAQASYITMKTNSEHGFAHFVNERILKPRT